MEVVAAAAAVIVAVMRCCCCCGGSGHWRCRRGWTAGNKTQRRNSDSELQVQQAHAHFDMCMCMLNLIRISDSEVQLIIRPRSIHTIHQPQPTTQCTRGTEERDESGGRPSC